MFESSIELNKSNSCVLISTFYVLIKMERSDFGTSQVKKKHRLLSTTSSS